MGDSKKPENARIIEIKERSTNLRDIYKQYRLLWELAPIFLQQEESLKLGKDYIGGTLTDAQRKERIRTIHNDIKKNKYYILRLFSMVKTVFPKDIKPTSPITLDVYKTLMSRQKMEEVATRFGCSLTDADFTKPDGSTMTDYRELADMFLRTKIMPAMYIYPWKQKEINAIVLSTVVAACMIATLGAPSVTSVEIYIGAALLAGSVVIFACIITLHKLDQSLTSRLATENRGAVDEEIRDLRVKAENDFKQAEEAQKKLDAEKQKNTSMTTKTLITKDTATRSGNSITAALESTAKKVKNGFKSLLKLSH